MPRQPLPTRFHSTWEIGPHVVDARPEHVAAIGKCMTLWPDVLHTMAVLLGVLLGANSEATIAVFSTLRNARARRDGIRAAAEVVLDAPKIELFDAVMAVIGSAEKERDHLAHGCFGICRSIPDGVLWIESKHVTPWNVSMLMKEPNFTGKEHAELAKKIFVYRLEDINAVHREIDEAWKATFDFIAYLRWTPSQGGLSDVERYRQLCNSPRLATALSQIRQDRKNNLKALRE